MGCSYILGHRSIRTSLCELVITENTSKLTFQCLSQ